MSLAILFVLCLGAVFVCDGQKEPRSHIVGGLHDVDPANNALIDKMARFAAKEMGSEYSLLEIKKAQTQVVAGAMYHMTITVKRTLPSNDVKTRECDVKVHEMQWVSYLELTEYTCRKL